MIKAMNRFSQRLISLFLVWLLLVSPNLALADTDAPEITNVAVVNNSETSITVTWETDENADSLINYGLQEDYGIVRVPEAERKAHSITIDDMEPGRLYYFRVLSSDETGNQGISAAYKVQLEGNPQEGSADGEGQAEGQGQASSESTTETVTTSQTTVEEIKEQIQEITNPQVIKEIQNELIKAIEGITEDLTIIGPPTVIPETNSAIVKWITDRPSSSEVQFAPSEQYVPGQYVYSQTSLEGDTTEHEVRLIGLEAFTDYHFQVISTDEFDITGRSRDYTFKTKASLPEIRNLRIVKVEENAATLAWDTTVPAKATIEYQDLTTGIQNSKGRPSLATTHQMRITDLTLGTRYVAFVIAENAGGDRVKSQPITFITVRDTAAPIITNVTNESTLFPGSESRIQTIVEWVTDEAAFCTMTYREGVAGGVEPTLIEPESVSYSEKHVEVIIDFAPATVYQFWLNCKDEAGNAIQSENFVLFTPIQEKNIIDLILENFESTFGWVKNIGG
jgi:hypothetical protein